MALVPRFPLQKVMVDLQINSIGKHLQARPPKRLQVRQPKQLLRQDSGPLGYYQRRKVQIPQLLERLHLANWIWMTGHW